MSYSQSSPSAVRQLGSFFPFGMFIAITLYFSVFAQRQGVMTLAHATPLATVSLAMAVVMRLSSYNLTVGAAVTLSAALVAKLGPEWGVANSWFVTALGAAVVGAIVGGVISYTRANSLLVTFGLLWAVQGLAALLLGGGVGTIHSSRSNDPALGRMLPTILFLIVLVSVAEYVVARTRLGWTYRAIGFNAERSNRAGIPVVHFYTAAFAISMVLCVIAAHAEMAHTSSFSTSLTRGWELDALLAVLMSRVLSRKLEISFWGTALSAVALTALSDKLNLFGLSYEAVYLFKGIAVAATAALSSWVANIGTVLESD